MELWRILGTVVLVVAILTAVATAVVLERRHLDSIRGELRQRLTIALPFLGILGFVLGFNMQFRPLVHDISWLIGWRITPLIVRIEGQTVAHLQSTLGESSTAFFAFMYVYGYVFLLVFPLVAYFFLQRLDVFKSITIAYAANYGIGLVCYLLFVAFGPRNHIPDQVDQLLYTHYPNLQLLTSEVNEATNVFPSLHASLSATVMLFAWRTREEYPQWLLIALFFGSSVIVSTMFLAIHWVVDVLAGLVLAGISYWIGVQAVERRWVSRAGHRSGWSRLVDQVR